jgi:hypothetical protein
MRRTNHHYWPSPAPDPLRARAPFPRHPRRACRAAPYPRPCPEARAARCRAPARPAPAYAPTLAKPGPGALRPGSPGASGLAWHPRSGTRAPPPGPHVVNPTRDVPGTGTGLWAPRPGRAAPRRAHWCGCGARVAGGAERGGRGARGARSAGWEPVSPCGSRVRTSFRRRAEWLRGRRTCPRSRIMRAQVRGGRWGPGGPCRAARPGGGGAWGERAEAGGSAEQGTEPRARCCAGQGRPRSSPCMVARSGNRAG